MVKGYLKYDDGPAFSSICTTVLRRLITIRYNEEMCIVTAANEFAHLVSAKTGDVRLTITHPENMKSAVVSEIEYIQSLNSLLIGYTNGDIVIYDFEAKESSMFQKHESNIDRIIFWDKELFNWVVSCSNDKRLVVWDLQSREEIYEIKNHGSPIADILIYKDWLVTLGKDGIVRQFELKTGILSIVRMTNKNELTRGLFIDVSVNNKLQSFLAIVASDELLLYKLENNEISEISFNIHREVFTKIIQIEQIGKTLMLLTSNGALETYKILDEVETLKKYKRKSKRGVKDLPEENEYMSIPSNYFVNYKNINLEKDCRAFNFLKGKNGSILYTTSFTNHIALYKLQDFEIIGKLKDFTFGHLNPINWGIMSSDDEFLITGSLDNVIIWETYNCNIVKKLGVQNSTSGVYLPGDKLIVVGTTKGELIIFNTDTSDLVLAAELEDSKSKKVVANDIKLLEVTNKIVSLGVVCSDTSMRKFKLIKMNNNVYGLEQLDNINLPDEPLKLEYLSTANKIIASFMDNSLRSYFNDERTKEDIQYYGHSLQVSDFAISSDEYVLASVSRDKSLRIWDIKFGNCRRIINSIHQGGASCIRIVKDTHYAFTGGRENKMKFWDLDTFELIMVFDGYMGLDIRSVVVSKIGDLVFSLGKNKTIRKYTQSKEQVFASEYKDEQEERELYVSGLGADSKIDEGGVIDKKIENLKTAENYMDLIERVEKEHGEAYTLFEEDLLLGKKREALTFGELDNLNPAEYVLQKFSQIPKHRLDSIFTFFHFNTFRVLLNYVRYALQNRIYVDLCLYIVRFILTKQSINMFKGEVSPTALAKCVELLKIIYEERIERERYINEGLGILVKETGYYTS